MRLWFAISNANGQTEDEIPNWISHKLKSVCTIHYGFWAGKNQWQSQWTKRRIRFKMWKTILKFRCEKNSFHFRNQIKSRGRERKRARQNKYTIWIAKVGEWITATSFLCHRKETEVIKESTYRKYEASVCACICVSVSVSVCGRTPKNRPTSINLQSRIVHPSVPIDVCALFWYFSSPGRKMSMRWKFYGANLQASHTE